MKKTMLLWCAGIIHEVKKKNACWKEEVTQTAEFIEVESRPKWVEMADMSNVQPGSLPRDVFSRAASTALRLFFILLLISFVCCTAVFTDNVHSSSKTR